MYKLTVRIEKDEFWYGGDTNYGFKMPIGQSGLHVTDTTVIKSYGQANTFFLSSNGRIIYSSCGFKTLFLFGSIICTSKKADIRLYTAQTRTLKGAYQFAVKNFMTPNGIYPDELMFKAPQYCTWIELDNNQNENGILSYAKSILDNQMPAGELIIDDGWQTDFGNWNFDKNKFTNPKKMIDILHTMGFKVILWICPFISSKAPDFEQLKNNNLLVRDKYNAPVSRQWWNGSDYLLDFSNPKAAEWFEIQTNRLIQEYGVDGFKQDAGDAMYYRDDDITHKQADANTQSKLWAESAQKYRFNELRACFQCGCSGVAQRLADKSHKWGVQGLGALIPNVLTQGISGYAFSCPDMIGGGQISDFRGVPPEKLDHELFARYCQASALMPMMQYSLSIWNMENETTKNVCIAMSKLHCDYADCIIELARNASVSGEPIVRYMEYVFPHCGYQKIKSQFMLGNDILVAPVLKKGETKKQVYIPKGKWEYNGKIYSDEKADIYCPKDKLIFLKRVGEQNYAY